MSTKVKGKLKKAKAAPVAAKDEVKRWDVVIYEMATRKVVSVAGTGLREEGSFHTVDKRIETALSRINLDHYSATKVPPGKYDLNSIIDEADLK